MLEQLPDDTSIEDIQYHLYVLQRIAAGEAELDAGTTIPHDEVMKELASWVE